MNGQGSNANKKHHNFNKENCFKLFLNLLREINLAMTVDVFESHTECILS